MRWLRSAASVRPSGLRVTRRRQPQDDALRRQRPRSRASSAACPTAPARSSRRRAPRRRSSASATTRPAARCSRDRSCSRGSARRRPVDAQCNQPPSFSYLYKSSTPGAGLQSYDPDNPPSDVATTTTDQGVEVPFIVRLETGYIDRDQYQVATLYQPDQPGPRRAARAVQPQAADHPRRRLRRRATRPARHPSVTERRRRDGARARLGDDVERARPQRPQLQHRGPGRVAADDQGARDRLLRHAPLHDRHRLLGRLPRHAVGRQRLPRHLPGHPAELLVPRRLEHGDAVPRLPPDARLLQWTRRVGTRGRLDADADGRRPGPRHDRQLAGLRHRPSSTSSSRPTLRRHHRRRALRPDSNPGGVRCSIPDAAINIFGPRSQSVWTPQEKTLGHGFAGHPGRQRRRPVRARLAAQRARSARLSSSISTPRSAASTSTSTRPPNRIRPTARRSRTPTAAG